MNKIWIIILCFVLTGCSTLAHLQELLRLQEYSNNKDAQYQAVLETKERFNKLVDAVQSDEIRLFGDKEKVTLNFGMPIVTKKVILEGRVLLRWLYRYPVDFEGYEKVYLYFEQDGRLVHWEYFVKD